MRVFESLAKMFIALLVIAICRPTLAVGDEVSSDRVAAGKIIYERSCSPCHGAKGKGDGFVAPNLDTHPRNFTSGVFTFRTTTSGDPPTDADLTRTITHGLHDTAMSPWAELSDQDLKDVIAYVKQFSEVFGASSPTPITVPEPPPFTVEAVKQGRHWFKELGCVECHGETGIGNGPKAKDLKDDWGFPIRPRNLTKADQFKRGTTAREIFYDVFTGLSGTPMPDWSGNLEDPKDNWNVIYFVYWLSHGASFEKAARQLKAERDPSSAPPSEPVPY